jgi:NitT/TauT family transport system permease protein/sulfonate transport system permease protein
LGRFVFFRKILFKFSLPYIFTGLKIGIGMAWICVIAAELIGAQSGLGYFIQLNRLMLQTDKMLVGMILIGIIGYFLNYLISTAEKTVVKWGTK